MSTLEEKPLNECSIDEITAFIEDKFDMTTVDEKHLEYLEDRNLNHPG